MTKKFLDPKCSFDSGWITDHVIVHPTGEAAMYCYHCTLCLRFHWSIPACEASGTCDDPESMWLALRDAIQPFYPVPARFQWPIADDERAFVQGAWWPAIRLAFE